MLSLDELRQIPGVTFPDDTLSKSDGDQLRFDVATYAIQDGENVPLVLEVRCPLSRGRPIFGAAGTRVNRQGGGPAPRHWLGTGLEQSLERQFSLERSRRGRVEVQERARTEERQRRERAEAVAAALTKAANQFVAGAGESPAKSLPEFLRLCGEAFVAAQPTVPIPK